ncbi:hypothetical protein QBC35DRAFT_447907 [Podospora australis]|uniref:Uncharacterized protein n=1 Tax=Podospora australis TaxID=1536484 RepID=A0AAN6X694_9PEZI|nr:hypothetical protein QBC35DRAFT_447907 [Podospora australis]
MNEESTGLPDAPPALENVVDDGSTPLTQVALTQGWSFPDVTQAGTAIPSVSVESTDASHVLVSSSQDSPPDVLVMPTESDNEDNDLLTALRRSRAPSVRPRIPREGTSVAPEENLLSLAHTSQMATNTSSPPVNSTQSSSGQQHVSSNLTPDPAQRPETTSIVGRLLQTGDAPPEGSLLSRVTRPLLVTPNTVATATAAAVAPIPSLFAQSQPEIIRVNRQNRQKQNSRNSEAEKEKERGRIRAKVARIEARNRANAASQAFDDVRQGTPAPSRGFMDFTSQPQGEKRRSNSSPAASSKGDKRKKTTHGDSPSAQRSRNIRAQIDDLSLGRSQPSALQPRSSDYGFQNTQSSATDREIFKAIKHTPITAGDQASRKIQELRSSNAASSLETTASRPSGGLLDIDSLENTVGEEDPFLRALAAEQAKRRTTIVTGLPDGTVQREATDHRRRHHQDRASNTSYTARDTPDPQLRTDVPENNIVRPPPRPVGLTRRYQVPAKVHKVTKSKKRPLPGGTGNTRPAKRQENRRSHHRQSSRPATAQPDFSSPSSSPSPSPTPPPPVPKTTAARALGGLDRTVSQYVVCRTSKLVPPSDPDEQDWTRRSRSIRCSDHLALNFANQHAQERFERPKRGVVGRNWEYVPGIDRDQLPGLFSGSVKYSTGEVEYYWVEVETKDLWEVGMPDGSEVMVEERLQAYARKRFDVWSHVYEKRQTVKEEASTVVFDCGVEDGKESEAKSATPEAEEDGVGQTDDGVNETTDTHDNEFSTPAKSDGTDTREANTPADSVEDACKVATDGVADGNDTQGEATEDTNTLEADTQQDSLPEVVQTQEQEQHQEQQHEQQQAEKPQPVEPTVAPGGDGDDGDDDDTSSTSSTDSDDDDDDDDDSHSTSGNSSDAQYRHIPYPHPQPPIPCPPGTNALDLVEPKATLHGSFTTAHLANIAALNTSLELAKPNNGYMNDNIYYSSILEPQLTEQFEAARLGEQTCTDLFELEWDPPAAGEDGTSGGYHWEFLRMKVEVMETGLKGPVDLSDAVVGDRARNIRLYQRKGKDPVNKNESQNGEHAGDGDGDNVEKETREQKGKGLAVIVEEEGDTGFSEAD